MRERNKNVPQGSDYPRRFLPRGETRRGRGAREGALPCAFALPGRRASGSGVSPGLSRAQEGSLYTDTLATTPRVLVAREPYVNPCTISRIHRVRVNHREGEEIYLMYLGVRLRDDNARGASRSFARGRRILDVSETLSRIAAIRADTQKLNSSLSLSLSLSLCGERSLCRAIRSPPRGGDARDAVASRVGKFR